MLLLGVVACYRDLDAPPPPCFADDFSRYAVGTAPGSDWDPAHVLDGAGSGTAKVVNGGVELSLTTGSADTAVQLALMSDYSAALDLSSGAVDARLVALPAAHVQLDLVAVDNTSGWFIRIGTVFNVLDTVAKGSNGDLLAQGSDDILDELTDVQISFGGGHASTSYVLSDGTTRTGIDNVPIDGDPAHFQLQFDLGALSGATFPGTFTATVGDVSVACAPGAD